MKLKSISKTLATVLAVAAVPALTISCAAETKTVIKTKINTIEKQDITKLTSNHLDHDWSFTTNPWWINIMKETFIKDHWDHKPLPEVITGQWKSKNATYTKLVLNLATHLEQPSAAHRYASNVSLAVFDKGTPIDLLTANGLPNWTNIKNMKNAQSHDYISNFNPHTLAEGGALNEELIVINGVIYNPPLQQKTNYENLRAGVFVDKNNDLSFIKDIPSSPNNDHFVNFSIDVNGKNMKASEKRGIHAFDTKLINFGTKDQDYDSKDYGGTQNLGDDEIRVITNNFPSEEKTYNFKTDHLKGYIVEATVANGISTYNSFGSINIAQAPFKGRVIKDVSNEDGYKIPRGMALIVSKKLSLDLNDKVDSKYEFDNSALGKKMKTAKFATSEIDYAQYHWVPHFDLANRTVNKDYVSNYLDPVVPQNLSFNGSLVLNNGVQPNVMPWIYDQTKKTQVAMKYIVKNSNTGQTGIISFNKNSFNDTMVPVAMEVLYMRSLGFDSALAIDGGGSIYSFVKRNGKLTPFRKSSDGRGYRVLTDAIAFGGEHE